MITTILIISILSSLVWLILKSRNMEIWIVQHIIERISSLIKPNQAVINVYVCLADHFEPFGGEAENNLANQRVDNWVKGYPIAADQHKDSNGRCPQHTFFYPEEEYDKEILNKIQKICEEGYGDVEIHLHHNDDTDESLRLKLNGFKKTLHETHGLLRKDRSGNIIYGFIHGNWALDNSRPDGCWCGVDNEIDVLIETGCKFDMTMPSAPSDTQTQTINKIYFAKEDGKPKSHNKGRVAAIGDWAKDDELLMIQGPLTLNWKSRKFGLIPRIENGEISRDSSPSLNRTRLWRECAISVNGSEDNIFIKLHTHGAEEANTKMFFEDKGFHSLWNHLERTFRDNDNSNLYYVTAWEMHEKLREIASSSSQ